MCGIAGIVAVGSAHADERARLPRMRDVIAHRGPDDAGTVRRRPGRARPPPAEHRRSGRRAPAAVERRRHGLDRLQRRDLQPRRRPARARSRRPPLPHAVRHRDDRPRLRGVGRRLRRAPARHVRVRDLGRAAPAAAARARSPRHQAALLGDRRRPAAVRIGDQVDPRERPDPRRGQRGARCPSCSARATSRRRDAVQGHPPAAARPHARLRGRHGHDPRSTGTCRPAAAHESSRGSPSRTPSQQFRDAARGGGPHPADGRRAARHVPLRRPRQQRHRRADGAA